MIFQGLWSVQTIVAESMLTQQPALEFVSLVTMFGADDLRGLLLEGGRRVPFGV